mmetsp:Transcript_35014/g.108370  ORF Transcript_35014/g.108370 Transcript_35014/m.108370 type:complete len:233 (-) Transcript_35014:16-714(-)
MSGSACASAAAPPAAAGFSGFRWSGSQDSQSLPSAFHFRMVLFRVMSLFSLNDFRESRRHLTWTSVMLSVNASSHASMQLSPKGPLPNRINVVSVVLALMPSAMRIEPSESILLASRFRVVSDLFVASSVLMCAQSAFVISLPFKISSVQFVFVFIASAIFSQYSNVFILKSALFERSTDVVAASLEASFSTNAFGLGAPKRNLLISTRARRYDGSNVIPVRTARAVRRELS